MHVFTGIISMVKWQARSQDFSWGVRFSPKRTFCEGAKRPSPSALAREGGRVWEGVSPLPRCGVFCVFAFKIPNLVLVLKGILHSLGLIMTREFNNSLIKRYDALHTDILWRNHRRWNLHLHTHKTRARVCVYIHMFLTICWDNRVAKICERAERAS